MSEYLQKIVYLNQSDYDLLAQGTAASPKTVTKNGVTLTNLNSNWIYITDGKVEATDLDDGLIVPVSKGGTGASSWASGKILVGNGSNTFSTIDKAVEADANTLVQRDSSGNFKAGTITAALSGNATTMDYPSGFTSKATSAAWGNTTGTFVTSWVAPNSSAIAFMRDNPSSGKLSVKVDGRYYFNEGTTPAAGLKSANGYWGMTGPDGEDNIYIRTTSQGIIPYQSGGASAGHCYLGTSSWYFRYAYIQDIYGTLNGTLKATGNQGSAWNDVGIIFTNGSRIGENTSKGLGIYAGERIYLRPDSATASSGDGVEISSTGLYPSNNNTETLGQSDHKWLNVYATTFTGNLTGNVTGNVSGTASNVTGTVAVANGGTGETTKLAAGLIYTWTAIVQGQKWSRLCYVPYSTQTTGTSLIINVRGTRGSVVYNYSLIINTLHANGQCHINVLQGNDYSSIKIRGVTENNGHMYIELYDAANSIASGTTQNVQCNMLILTKGATEPTLYTAFTDGTTIPSGYTAHELELKNSGGFQTSGNMYATEFIPTGSTTSLKNNNLTFAQGGGWYMSDATWIRTVGSKSIYMNSGTFRNDGTTQVRTLQHVNTNIAVDGTWITGATGTAGDGTNTGTTGTSILAIGNATAVSTTNGSGKDNSQGYLRLFGSGTGYAQITAYNGDKVRMYPEEGISIPRDKIGIMFRPDSASYYTHISYQTNGNEALVFATQNAVTSFIFVNGESYANVASNRWISLDGSGASGKGNAPGLQIKKNCVYIGELLGHTVEPSYKLNVKGTTNLNGAVTVPHAAGASDGVKVTYSTTIDFFMGVGTGNENHGIYDNKASKWVLSAGSANTWTFDGNAATATTASKLSNTSAIGSDVKPVYFTSGGVPQATATEMLRGFTTTNAGTDLNAMYDSGTYSITGGTLSNYPTGGSAYATILTVAYRKPSGNTKPDYAWQMGNFTQDSDRLWYRTSQANAWRAWRQIVSIATNTATGNSSTPVYIDANGAVQTCTAYSSATVGNANKVAAKLAATTKHFLVGTSTTLTATAANVELLGDGGIYATTTSGELSAVRHSYNSSGTEKAYTVYNTTDNSIDFIFV